MQARGLVLVGVVLAGCQPGGGSSSSSSSSSSSGGASGSSSSSTGGGSSGAGSSSGSSTSGSGGAARDQPCDGNITCAADLFCDDTAVTWSQNPTCHKGCTPPGTSTCGPEACIPVGSSFQMGDGSFVSCELGRPDTCDTANGYTCRPYAGIAFGLCQKTVAACGTPVMPYYYFNADGGYVPLTTENACNTQQTVFAPDGGALAPSRFCQQFPLLAHPPPVECVQRRDSLGYCLATCAVRPWHLDDAGMLSAPEMLDCPTGYTCNTTAGIQYRIEPVIRCSLDAGTGCPAAALCGDSPSADGGACYSPQGVCVTL